MEKDKTSPMMKHYIKLKSEYPDTIILYRLGDFYELFNEDALKCSKLLNLTLTSKSSGGNNKSPMCGIPQKALDVYVSKLLEHGEKVAICEQLSDPKPGTIVERDIVRIITPGTVIDADIIDNKSNVYIASIYFKDKNAGISYADISTGEFVATEFVNDEKLAENINNYLAMFSPREVICNRDALNLQSKLSCVNAKIVPEFTLFGEDLDLNEQSIFSTICEQFNFKKRTDCPCQNNTFALSSSYLLINYINQTQKRHLSHMNNLKFINTNSYMQFDANTRLNLELVYSIKDRKKRNSLYWILDKTKTTMGSRLLRSYIEKPLFNEKLINYRLNAVNDLYKNIISREKIRESLSAIYDLERLCGRISYGNLSPKDCVLLKNSLESIPVIKNELAKFSSKMLIDINNQMDNLEEIYNLINSAINEETSSNNIKDPGFIKVGYNSDLDEYIKISSSGVDWITDFEAKEKNRTNIKNLKVKYNKVFGYFIEITKSQLNSIPYNYIRRQTIANAERFITEELKNMENKVLNAEEQRYILEVNLFNEIRTILLEKLEKLQSTANALCTLDVLCSLATVAAEKNYCKPIINSKNNSIEIIDGRHPVIESIIKDEDFIPNDTFLNSNDCKTMIITGPNMAGKSTYMRQVALIVIMAHIGSFVPASSAKIGLTDRIFTRIGANDDLAFGQSTFMVEMNEVSNILNNSTPNSLVLLDEVGRGTSTFDGLSIAWSVLEYINNNLNVKTLFATHFHELTELETKLTGIKNYRINVKEYDGKVVFLRKIVRGSANRSFGIEVASLANLPNSVIDRAKIILKALESNDLKTDIKPIEANQNNEKIRAKNLNRIYEIISDIDVNKLTPLLAFDTLVELSNIIKKD